MTTAARALTILALLASLTLIHSYQETYTDDSNAKCVRFALFSHDFDLCHGPQDRPNPLANGSP